MTHRKPYSTDISNAEWAVLEPLIPKPKTGGRPRSVNIAFPKQLRYTQTFFTTVSSFESVPYQIGNRYIREIVNAIFYILAAGCAWRLMPHDLPSWSTVYHYFLSWRIQGTWLVMNQVLCEKVRTQVNKNTTPSATIEYPISQNYGSRYGGRI